MATLSLRLDAEIASLVDLIARRSGLSKSDAIRAAIREYAQKLEENSGPSFYDKIKDHVGVWESGDPHLSTRTGDEIAQMMLEERQRRDLGRRRATRRAG
jgi:metal-responsive CopG/Arc/MetJ family transcriptional regulator